MKYDAFFKPASIAVVGASRDPAKVGNQIIKNLIDGNYSGAIYPINPNAKEVHHLRCFPTLHDVPKPVDLAVIATPAPLVKTILEECGTRRIQHAVIISAGFAEAGSKGKALQQELSETIIKHKLQVIGPNCLGIASSHNKTNATFGPALPKSGNIMLISQSGALVTGILDFAKKCEMGISHAVTLGNRISWGENDALRYAAADKATKVIMIYLESFQNAPEFFSLCSTISPEKPIVLLKGGQTKYGQSASLSHTAALASNYALIKAFAAQTGVILTDTLEEWLQLGAAFAHHPKTNGANLTILTNAGGPGVMAADEAATLGIELEETSKITKQRLEKTVDAGNVHNPIDILGDATPDRFAAALTALEQDKSIHHLMIIVTPQTTTEPIKTAEIIASSKLAKNIPVYPVFIGSEIMDPAREVFEKAGMIHFDFPTQALHIIAHKAAYESHKQSTFHYPAKINGFISEKQRHTLTERLKTSLSLPVAFDMLHAYGFTLPKSAIITKVDEVPEAVSHVGKPAAVKTANLKLAHKAAAGGVFLNIMSVADARLAFRKLQMMHHEVLVQQMIKGNFELILGARRDPILGPFVTIGIGGTFTNEIADRSFAFAPAQKKYLEHVFKQTKAYEIAIKEEADIEPIINALYCLQAIMEELPIIREIEINPAIVTRKCLYAADVKISLNDA